MKGFEILAEAMTRTWGHQEDLIQHMEAEGFWVEGHYEDRIWATYEGHKFTVYHDDTHEGPEIKIWHISYFGK